MNNFLKRSPLFDQPFLNKLFNYNEKEIYAKIILLNIHEEPIEQIEGKIIDGTINIDGTSAVRRTCSLSMVAENVDINEFYWGLKSKFKLEIGLRNFIDTNYPDIIWFKQGVFVISQFNTSQSLNKWDIKIQGKDKMCLLNGELSGQLPLADFAVEQFTDASGIITFNRLPIKTIIKKLLQEFALELPHNILINDIDEAGQELLEYQGLEPLYLFHNVNTNEYENMSVNADQTCYYQLRHLLTQEEYDSIPEKYIYLKNFYIRTKDNNYEFKENRAIENNNYKNNIIDSNWFKGTISDSFNIIYNNLLDDNEFEGGEIATSVRFENKGIVGNELYTIVKIQSGDTPGYRLTDLVFAGELKSNAGETITSILDKIKNQFVNFEYYYDIDGKFVFQKKKDCLTIPWNSAEYDADNISIDAGINNNGIQFNFIDSKLITSFNNNPSLMEVKNDYSVHGIKNNVPIHMRYAIDHKPEEYTPIRVLKEKIITIHKNSVNNIIEKKEEYKYYDAPEIEPYNEEGLIRLDESYKVLEFLDFQVNDPSIPDNRMFRNTQVLEFQKSLNVSGLDEDFCTRWFSLFVKANTFQYQWQGTNEDIKEMIFALNETNNIYENKVQMSIIPDGNGGEVWTIIYPYFAKYPYRTSHVIQDISGNIKYTNVIGEEDTVIHYKVDWRELIYQMYLDYRKLNSTDNYYHYLKLANPQFIYNKTNYEQYYIDIGNWRDIYNPNPEKLFHQTVSYLDVKRQTLLNDEYEGNEDSDLFYIKNGYRLITQEDKDILDYTNIYEYSAPFGEGYQIKSIYPFAFSETCHLKKQDEKYYIEDDITKRMRPAFNQDNSTVTTNIDMLTEIATSKIYIKNDLDFDTLLFRATLVELTEETYEPFVYYIKNDGQYELSVDDYNNKKEYYLLENRIDYSDGMNSDNSRFRVLAYPSVTTLNSEYEENAVADYILYAQSEFLKNKDNILDPYPDDAERNNNKYFVEDKSFIKLSDIDILKDLYYRSDIIPLSYKTSDFINSLDVVIKTFSSYSTDPITYLNMINEIIKTYILYLQTIEYEDIKQIFFTIFKNKLLKYMTDLQSTYNNLSNYQNQQDISCLYYIFNYLKTSLEKINLNEEYESSNSALLEIITNFNKLNLCAQNVITSLNLNYEQVKFLDKSSLLLSYLDTTNEDSDKKKFEKINSIIRELTVCLEQLSLIKNTYIEGQMEKTKFSISSIIDTANNSLEGVTEKDTEAINNILIYLKEAVQAVMDTIGMLSDCISNLQNLVIQQMVWTPNLLIDENTKDTDIIEAITNKKKTDEVYNFLSKLKALKGLFDPSVDTATKMKDFIKFNDYIFFEDLYEQLDGASDAEAQNFLKEFNENTSNYQENIILEDVNNFNEVNSNKVYYYPIEYYKASYAYNHNALEGNYWLLDIFKSPSLLTFWFDFLEPTSNEMLKFSVPAIGIRSKVINDNMITAIHHKEIPSIIFKNNMKEDYNEISGYTYINLTNAFMNLFKVSARGKTAKNKIEELLLNHSYCAQNINIQTSPIYNLSPNNKIYIRDDKSKIDGEYNITKLTIPLNYKKMMSITATKVAQNIL